MALKFDIDHKRTLFVLPYDFTQPWYLWALSQFFMFLPLLYLLCRFTPVLEMHDGYYRFSQLLSATFAMYLVVPLVLATRRMLPGLTSMWARPSPCKYWSPHAILRKQARAQAHIHARTHASQQSSSQVRTSAVENELAHACKQARNQSR